MNGVETGWHLANRRTIFSVFRTFHLGIFMCDTGVKVNAFKIATRTPFDLIYECISFHFSVSGAPYGCVSVRVCVYGRDDKIQSAVFRVYETQVLSL